MLNAPRHKNEGVHRSGEGGRRAHYVTQWLISVTEGRESESRVDGKKKKKRKKKKKAHRRPAT